MKNNVLAMSVKLGAVVGLVAMTGCAEYHKRVLHHTEERGSEFTRVLAKEYEILGETEQAVMYDQCAAAYYFQKAIIAKKGCPVMPTTLDKWDVDPEYLPELALARERLMLALEAGAWEATPKMTAHAQAYFDCWIEQQGEGWQKEDIADCRAEFYKSMAEVELMLMGGIMGVSPSNMVFFDYGSAHLNADAMKLLDEVVAAAMAPDYKNHILLVGRTDRVGDAVHNKHLSKHRAIMVKKELIRRGIPPHRISIKAVGETAGPHVDVHNRRVDIIFLDYK